MIRRAVPAVLVAALIAAPLQAADASAGYRELQAKEQRLFAAGWRLATANAPFCRETTPGIGLLLHDATSYARPGEVREALGLSGDIAVQAVAPGSPAEAAGLRTDDAVLAIGGVAVGQPPPRGARAWERLSRINAALDAAAATGPVELRWRRKGGAEMTASLVPVAACTSRFEVLGSGKGAAADGRRVLVDYRFPAFAYPDDVFAAAVAHELAHNVLGHLERTRRQVKRVRVSEGDADRLAVWLLANAGYDPAAMGRFMALWGPRHDGGFLRSPTHQGWDERAAAIAAEYPKVAAALAGGGKADWARLFTENLATLEAR